MKKCCFINPYFGKLPNYFPLFVKTCSYNKEFDWILITDNDININLPENIIVKKMQFEDLKNMIQKKFDFEISLDRPYKLCDYKPAYGYIFEELIKDYKYWGHCDLDTLMGNLSSFLTDELLEQYDKLFCLGHMIIYRNTIENNRVFMTEIEGRKWYKESFSTSKITTFDETYKNNTNVNEIFVHLNKRVLEEDWSANFKVLPTNFIKTTYNSETKDFDNDNQKSLYIWNDGNIYRYYIKNNKLIRENFLYIHLQERKMKFNSKILNNNIFKIVPNYFMNLEVKNITLENFNKIKIVYFNTHYLQYKLKWQKRKLQRIIKKLRGEKI